jgi:hypothetical protein
VEHSSNNMNNRDRHRLSAQTKDQSTAADIKGKKRSNTSKQRSKPGLCAFL